MTIKKMGLFLLVIFGLFLVPVHKIVAKSDNSAASQSAKEQRNDQKLNNENGEEHRSVVASFVQSLLDVADREGGIGEQVRVIAQQQNDSKEETTVTIDKIEKRNKLKTFLIGTDYKNIGVLRSEMVRTRNQIEQLKKLVDKAKNEDNKVELQAQIQKLEEEQIKINNFISQNESKFSLFGWAVKLFNK